MLDPERIRADFPIFAKGPKGRKPPVYLDSAATSQKPRQVIDALADFYSRSNSNVHRGLYRLAEDATLAFENVREEVRDFINAKESREIIFTKNSTEAANLVMRAWGERNIRKGDRIVTTILEHHSNFVPWQQLARMKGAEFRVVGMDDEGMLDMADFEKACKGAKLAAFTAASNVTGTLCDVKRMCAIARDAGALSLVDAAQSVPSMATDVSELGCDFLMFSGHKMLAPFGSGILYGRAEILESMDPFMYGSEMISTVGIKKSQWSEIPYRFEPGTPDVAAIIGLGHAIRYLKATGLSGIRAHEVRLVGLMLERLHDIKGLEIIGAPEAKRRGPLVAFTLKGVHPHDVAAILAEDNICVRSGHHCAMPVHERLGIPASTRASVYLYNTESEILALGEGLAKAKKVFG